ncbi:MAG: redoxin domain-containing protein [Deltaproteobacteria bacterium]|nr:MAG: redoxin domain-containing protein [Deltaproteobacteria bacterium]
MALAAGTAAPDFTLFQSKGETVTLSELRGNKVVLVFFPAAFTGLCQEELCSFQDALAQFNDMNAKVLGISVDGLFTVMAFKSQNGLEFPVLTDYSRSTVRAYDVALDNFAGMEGYTASQRAVFVIDAEGTIAWSWQGANPGVLPDYDAVAAAVAAA